MKTIKIIVPSLLFLALLFDVSGHIFVFFKMQKDIHRKIKRLVFENLPESELEIFTHNIDEDIPNIKWIHSREFSLNGKMYDIVKRDTSDGLIVLHCVWDREEEELINKYSSIVSNKVNDIESNFTKIPIFNIDFYFIKETKNIIQYEKIDYPDFIKNELLIGIKRKIDPPPKLI